MLNGNLMDVSLIGKGNFMVQRELVQRFEKAQYELQVSLANMPQDIWSLGQKIQKALRCNRIYVTDSEMDQKFRAALQHYGKPGFPMMLHIEGSASGIDVDISVRALPLEPAPSGTPMAWATFSEVIIS